MRVVLSNSSYKWGGVHRITESLAVGLEQRGHQVHLLSRPDSLLDQRLRERFDTHAVVKGGDLSPLGLLRIRRTLSRIKPDILVTLMEKDLRLSGAAAKPLGIPVLARRANDEPLRSDLYSRLVYNNLSTHHVANSQATRATMLASAPWLDGERVSVIYNGIEVEHYAQARPAELDLDGLRVGLIARLERRKGVGDLLDAWPTVSAAVPDARLVMVGRGAMDEEVRSRAAALERVHVLGYRTDVAAVLKALDLVVVPSHWEGFGLIAAEAMAAGRPVIAAAASSLPEVVGEAGLLVPPGDAQALARAIVSLLQDPTARARLAASGQARVRELFTVDRMVDDYERLMATLT